MSHELKTPIALIQGYAGGPDRRAWPRTRTAVIIYCEVTAWTKQAR
ncbi:MAG: hypothetical protein ACLR0U_09745 [Enterocloster clostridioformis]